MKKLKHGILTENEYDTLILRLKKRRTFEEISKVLNLSSRSNAHIIFNNAIRKLKKSKGLVNEFKQFL